jgi:hypothetical protein
MADQFKLSGGYTTTPLDGVQSFDPNIDAVIDESLVLIKKNFEQIDLNVDTPVVVPFGGVTNANVVLLKAVGGKVKARFTSADGTQQAVPFDTYLILMSLASPITAIDLVRTPATPATVRVFLGERA